MSLHTSFFSLLSGVCIYLLLISDGVPSGIAMAAGSIGIAVWGCFLKLEEINDKLPDKDDGQPASESESVRSGRMD